MRVIARHQLPDGTHDSMNPSQPTTIVMRALAEPGRALAVARALLKGHWYRVFYRLRGVRFRAGRNLRVFGRLSIRGPGEVVFGDNVVLLDTATPWTYSREAAS